MTPYCSLWLLAGFSFGVEDQGSCLRQEAARLRLRGVSLVGGGGASFLGVGTALRMSPSLDHFSIGLLRLEGGEYLAGGDVGV